MSGIHNNCEWIVFGTQNLHCQHIALGFSDLFSLEKECEKQRAVCQTNIAQKKGEPRPIFKFRFLRSFSLLDTGNYEMCYFKGPGGRIEASWRHNGRLVEAFWGLLRVSWGAGELRRTQVRHFGRPKSLQDAETSKNVSPNEGSTSVTS